MCPCCTHLDGSGPRDFASCSSRVWAAGSPVRSRERRRPGSPSQGTRRRRLRPRGATPGATGHEPRGQRLRWQVRRPQRGHPGVRQTVTTSDGTGVHRPPRRTTGPATPDGHRWQLSTVASGGSRGSGVKPAGGCADGHIREPGRRRVVVRRLCGAPPAATLAASSTWPCTPQPCDDHHSRSTGPPRVESMMCTVACSARNLREPRTRRLCVRGPTLEWACRRRSRPSNRPRRCAPLVIRNVPETWIATAARAVDEKSPLRDRVEISRHERVEEPPR